jgi:pimeloyl-ACP methyl ester carboxylesterase
MNTPASAPPALLSAHRQGTGDTTVVCLHSSTGSHSQWRGVKGALDQRCRLLVPDLYGHGDSPAWPAEQPSALTVDADAVLALLREDGDAQLARGVHLVGHSYGAAVAMQIALARPQWVRSLTLYEPVAFGVLRALVPNDDALSEIEDIAHSVAALVALNDLEGAARVFVRYWGGAAAWNGLNSGQRAALMARIPTVPRHFEALFAAQWGSAQLSRLAMPVLLLQGADTRAPARLVSELLGVVLPHVGRVRVPEAGHLGAITHDAGVTPLMVAHIGLNGRLAQTGEASAAQA